MIYLFILMGVIIIASSVWNAKDIDESLYQNKRRHPLVKMFNLIRRK